MLRFLCLFVCVLNLDHVDFVAVLKSSEALDCKSNIYSSVMCLCTWYTQFFLWWFSFILRSSVPLLLYGHGFILTNRCLHMNVNDCCNYWVTQRGAFQVLWGSKIFRKISCLAPRKWIVSIWVLWFNSLVESVYKKLNHCGCLNQVPEIEDWRAIKAALSFYSAKW